MAKFGSTSRYDVLQDALELIKTATNCGKGRGFCQNLCVATHFCTFGPNLGTIDQRRAEVYTVGKISSLEVQKFQNHSHKRKVIAAEV